MNKLTNDLDLSVSNNLIPYARFNNKQVNYILRSQIAWLNVLEGGKRSGKNITNLVAWAMILDKHPDKIHLAAGYTKGTSRMNIIDSNGFGLKFIYKGRCREGLYQGIEALYIQTKTGEKVVLIVGGEKISDVARIKGFSPGTVYLTEVNEMNPYFVRETRDRIIASKDPKMFMDLNPKPPRHWFYADFLDPHMEAQAKDKYYGLNYAHMTIADNMSLSDKKLRDTLKTYDRDSQWFKRDILGLRTTAEGRIYTGYKYKDVAVTPEWIKEQQFIEFSVGIDIGGTDATVATITGFTPRYETTVLIDGYYHKQGINQEKDHADYAREIVAFIKPYTLVYPKLASSVIFSDSADKLFRQALRKELDQQGLRNMSVTPSYKADGIEDRIRLMQILINQGRKKIKVGLEPWFNAYEQAVWDTDKYQEKEWVRVDDGSYPVDCLDSDEYSIQPYKPNLLREGQF